MAVPTSNLQPPSVMDKIRKEVVHLKLRMEATEQLLKQGFIARRRGEEERRRENMPTRFSWYLVSTNEKLELPN
eukprot:scaffold30259_cov73-Skeletonema_marinoi.AAC.1